MLASDGVGFVYLGKGVWRYLRNKSDVVPRFLYPCDPLEKRLLNLKKSSVMMKKLSLLFAAFVLGAIISLAIQACGNESKIETGSDVTTDDIPSSESGSDISCNCAWSSQKFSSQIIYDENGLESARTDYEYDDIGRLVVMKYIAYGESVSGIRYLAHETRYNYTYADSDNIRYGTVTSVVYDENGAITNQTKTTEKMILYKQ